jgi:hypothetical protein
MDYRIFLRRRGDKNAIHTLAGCLGQCTGDSLGSIGCVNHLRAESLGQLHSVWVDVDAYDPASTVPQYLHANQTD